MYRAGNYVVGPAKQLAAHAHLYSNFQVSAAFQGRIIDRSLSISTTNREFARAFDILFARDLGAQLTDTADIILKNNPDFNQFVTQNTILEEVLTGKELTKTQQREFTTLLQTELANATASVMARLGKGEQRQANLARAFEAYVEGAEARASAVAAARRRATQTAIELVYCPKQNGDYVVLGSADRVRWTFSTISSTVFVQTKGRGSSL